MTYPQFPATFHFGSATAAYQVEGAWNKDGKGPSIWDIFVRKRGKIRHGHTGDVACDHYHRHDTDISLMRQLSLDVYRFSISWPRVLPQGKGLLNPKGLAFYDQLVDRLLAADIQPYITLFHWDMPHALYEAMDGFAGREVADHFADYGQRMVKHLGDRVKHWITLNEPLMHASQGYLLGVHAPGQRNPWAWLRTLHHQLLGHGKAVSQMKAARPDIKVGLTLSLAPIHPSTTSARDQRAADMGDQLINRSSLDPVFRGVYPERLWHRLRFFRPRLAADDMKIISTPIDFLGVNNYSRAVVHHAWYVPLLQLSMALNWMPPQEFVRDGVQHTGMGWEVYPQGIYEILMRLAHEYGNPPVYITENGAAFTDTVTEGRVHDPLRRGFLERYIGHVARAVREGADVRGYFVWSLLDNLEWAAGYSKRFGIVYVDHQTQQRIIKESGHWYSRLIRNQASRAV